MNVSGAHMNTDRAVSGSDCVALTNTEVFTYYPRLRRVIRYVDGHLAEPITRRDVAAVAALQETYFSTYFHTTVGIPFTEWIRQRRIAKAIQLFASEDLPVAAVSHRTGFTSTRTFQRVFKQVVGISPFEYKCEVRKRLLTTSSTIW